jgi:transposase-like protein
MCDGVPFDATYRLTLWDNYSTAASAKAAAVQHAIQRSQKSLQTLATRHGINPKTVDKWRKRATVQDAPGGAGTGVPASTVLTAEEAMAVAFRRHPLLTLDDCLYV